MVLAYILRLRYHILFFCRTQVQRLIVNRFDQIHKDLKMMLADVPHVSITLDIWSDRTMRGFLAVTVHFIKLDKLQTFLLTCERMTGWYYNELLCYVLFYLKCVRTCM